MKRVAFSVEVKGKFSELRVFLAQLGEVETVHVAQYPAKAGLEATSIMTVIYKKQDLVEKKDNVNFDEVIDLIKKASAPKDIDSLDGSYKRLKNSFNMLVMRLLMESLRITDQNKTRAVNMILEENLHTMMVASWLVKFFKEIPEEKIPDNLKDLYEWARERRPKGGKK